MLTSLFSIDERFQRLIFTTIHSETRNLCETTSRRRSKLASLHGVIDVVWHAGTIGLARMYLPRGFSCSIGPRDGDRDKRVA